MASRLVEALAEDINNGQLPPGTQLPPHRELADALGLSVGTVTRAYSMAKDRGLIAGTVGRGTFISSRDEGEESGEIDLRQNLIRWDPGESVAQLLRTALRERSDLRQLMEIYPNPAGSPEHRQTAARWLERRGFGANSEQTVITNGGQHGMLAVLTAHTKPGDLVATENVTYSGMKSIANQLHLRLAGLPMDEEGLLPEALDRLCAAQDVRVLYTIPTLQNPTGALMSEDRRETIADIARRRNITILEDDIYAFLVDRPPPPIAAFAPERCYFVTGLSKSVFPGLRLGFVVCPPGSSEAVTQAVRMSLLAVSPLTAALGTGWLADGTADRIIEWKRREIEWRWDMASGFFGLDTRGAHFASHLWLPIPGTRPVEEFVARVQRRGVLLAPAEGFAVNPYAVPRAVRISLGMPLTRARLQQALDVIREVMQGRTRPAQLI